MYNSHENVLKFWFKVWMKVKESKFTLSIRVSFLLVKIDHRLCRCATTNTYIWFLDWKYIYSHQQMSPSHEIVAILSGKISCENENVMKKKTYKNKKLSRVSSNSFGRFIHELKIETIGYLHEKNLQLWWKFCFFSAFLWQVCLLCCFCSVNFWANWLILTLGNKSNHQCFFTKSQYLHPNLKHTILFWKTCRNDIFLKS